MNFYQACESMKNRIAVESLVSHTTYEISKEGLLAEGLLVPFDHLTTEEANGEWREVTVIETMKEFQQLSEAQKQQILEDAIKHFEFHENVRMKK